MSEAKTFYDIISEKAIIETSDIDRYRIDKDISLKEMYKEYMRRKSQEE